MATSLAVEQSSVSSQNKIKSKMRTDDDRDYICIHVQVDRDGAGAEDEVLYTVPEGKTLLVYYFNIYNSIGSGSSASTLFWDTNTTAVDVTTAPFRFQKQSLFVTDADNTILLSKPVVFDKGVAVDDSAFSTASKSYYFTLQGELV